MTLSQRVIKKYSNRRLYDTELKTYITLEDIKKLIFRDIELQVIDAKTKKDITQSTLFLIIADQEAEASSIFSIPLLKTFIRFHPQKSNQTLSQYLEHAIDFFMQQKNLFDTQWKSYQHLFMDPSFLQKVMNVGKTATKKNKKEFK